LGADVLVQHVFGFEACAPKDQVVPEVIAQLEDPENVHFSIGSAEAEFESA